MSAQEVNIFLDSTSPPSTPVSGVYVGLHNSSSKALLQTATSDAAGKVTFSNVESDTNSGVYEIRIVPSFAASVAKGNVQNITVQASGNNNFDVQVTPEGLPVATNPRLCRCSGYFYDLTGKPMREVSLRFMEKLTPNVEYISDATIDARVVVPKTRILKTDKNGYVTVDLYRNSEYIAVIEGYENSYRRVNVPDSSAVNITDVLFPIVGSLEYAVAGNKLLPTSAPTTSVSAGQELEVTCTVLLRSGVTADPDEVTIESPNVAVVTADYSGGKLTLKGVASGGPVALTIKRITSDEGGVSVRPEPSVLGVLSVTVT